MTVLPLYHGTAKKSTEKGKMLESFSHVS